MKRDWAIDRDPVVRLVAEDLGIRGHRGLREAIAVESETRVQRWLDAIGMAPTTLVEVHALIINQVALKVERIHCAADLDEVIRKYERDIPAMARRLRAEFSAGTEAIVFRRRCADHHGASRFVAVIDARDSMKYRAWFGERHEGGHILIRDPSSKVVWRRTRGESSVPIELVVDAVASRVGFWRPLVHPVLVCAFKTSDSVLRAFEKVRQHLAPEASQEATYRALAELVDFPLVLLRVAEDCRREDRRIGNVAGSLALRATTVISNSTAERAGIYVWRNFRIPPGSVVAAAYDDPGRRTFRAEENLGTWRSSKGQALPPVVVRITACGAWATLQAA